MKREKMRFEDMMSVVIAVLLALVGGDAMAAAVAGQPAYTPGEPPAGLSEGVDGVGKHISNQKPDGEALVTHTQRVEVPDYIVDPVERAVLQMYQSSTPIEQITRMSRPEPMKGMRYQYYAVDTREIHATVVGIALKSANTQAEITLSDGEGALFDECDQILIPDAMAYDVETGEEDEIGGLNAYVTKVDGDKLICVAVNGKKNAQGNFEFHTSVAGTGLSLDVYRLGHAHAELDLQTAAYAALPQKEENFMQIFKSQSLESTISLESQHEVDWNSTDTDELIIHNMKTELELSYLFSKKNYFYNPVTKRWVQTTGGIVEQIMKNGNVITYNPDSVSENDMIDMCKAIFTGNKGSSDRILLAGAGLIATLSKIGGIYRTIDANSVERKFGYTFHNIETYFGSLHVLMHPLFEECGWSDFGIVIDTQYLRKKVFRSMSRTILNLIESGQMDAKGTVLTEISSVVLKYGKCHSILMPGDALTVTRKGETILGV